MPLSRRALLAAASAVLLVPGRARAATVTDGAGQRLAEGGVRDVLTRARLENLYGAPVEMLTDGATGTTAFLPG
jgi:hypothetical protein